MTKTSSPQTLPTVQVWDYLMSADNKPQAGRIVTLILLTDATSINPITQLPQQAVYSAKTDPNGFWTINVVPTDQLNPANLVYTVMDGIHEEYQINPTTGNAGGINGAQSSAITVNAPIVLLPASSTVTGPLTVQGLLTAQAGLVVSGGATTVGPLAAGNTTVNAFTAAGLATLNAGLTVVGAVTLPAASIADAALSANVALKNINNAFSVGQAITGGLTIATGGLAVTAGGATITAGDTTITAGKLVFGAASSQIVPGATSLSIRDNGNTRDNFLLLNTGFATLFRGLTLGDALTIPPSSGGTPAASSYGSVPVKIKEFVITVATASMAFTSIPSGFRHLLLGWQARGDTASALTAMLCRLNNVSTATYDYELARASAAAWSVAETLTATSINCGQMVAGTGTANYAGSGEIKIKNYSGATLNKTVLATSSASPLDTAGNQELDVSQGKWRTVGTAVSEVDLLPGAGNFITVVATLAGEP